MFLKAALLVIIAFLCLIGIIISLIFGVIAFANNKSHKYVWLTSFFGCLIGMVICIFMFVNKAVDRVKNFTDNISSHFEGYSDSLRNNNIDRYDNNENSAQVKLLKSYLPNNILNSVPEEFYIYAGFKDYYRLPLRFPFSIHCTNTKDNGELYNEVNVSKFDENENGEIYTNLGNINKIAFDKTYLLVEQTITSTRADMIINHYVLYNLDTEKKEEATSLSKLVQMAKLKGYVGADTLMTLEQYYSLF